MTVNVARRTRRRASGPAPAPAPIMAPAESLAIGEIDQTVFDCPSCARPLALGARRCPGCGLRLILGIPLAKASFLASLGLAVGIAIGLGAGVVAGLGHAPVAAPAVAILPSAAPILTGGGGGAVASAPIPSPLPAGGSGGSTSDIPALSRSAITQAIDVNGRLVAAGAALRVALDARAFDASVVAQLLRTMSADSIFGQQLAGRMGDWRGSAAVGADLTAAYGAIHASATEGLIASIRNDPAYRVAGEAMLKTLAGLATVDRDTRALALQVGIDVPSSPAP